MIRPTIPWGCILAVGGQTIGNDLWPPPSFMGCSMPWQAFGRAGLGRASGLNVALLGIIPVI